jgi:hydrogenase maturation protease
MERLVGYRRAILVDAVHGLEPDAGTVVCRPLSGLAPRAAAHLDGTHDASLATALEAGRAMGAPLPAEITVVGIEAASLGVFDERLTPEVAEAVPRAVELILGQLGPMGGDRGDH